MNTYTGHFFSFITCTFLALSVQAQKAFVIAGRVTDTAKHAMQGVTVRFADSKAATITSADGTFVLSVPRWCDSIQFSHAGFEKLTAGLDKTLLTGLEFQLSPHRALLQAVVVNMAIMDKEPGKRFMKKVIANKEFNDPDRFIKIPIPLIQGVPYCRFIFQKQFPISTIAVRLLQKKNILPLRKRWACKQMPCWANWINSISILIFMTTGWLYSARLMPAR